jgi:hypothetical protein
MRFRDELFELSIRSLHRDVGDPRNLSLDTGTEVCEDSKRDGEDEKQQLAVSTQHSASESFTLDLSNEPSEHRFTSVAAELSESCCSAVKNSRSLANRR